MISYNRGGIYHLFNIFKVSGSVFPRSFMVALPCAICAGVLRYMIDNTESLDFLKESDSILSNNQVFSGFTFLMGFLIVFRTSEAHSRFWQGANATHRMRADWFDAASAVCVMCHHSKVEGHRRDRFKQLLARLFSFLHSAAVAELDTNSRGKEADEMRGFKFAVLDPGGLDEDSLHALRECQHRVELLFGWIQGLLVTEIGTGLLCIPPPILARVFQELSNGMVAFNDAQMIATTPFPFPYAQTCDCLLLMHWILVPFVTTQWVKSVTWCAIFVFVQVFILWTLNFIAVEIEDPFGEDANDLDGRSAQEHFNHQLILLLEESSVRIPKLSLKAGSPMRISASLSDTWTKLDGPHDETWSLGSHDGLENKTLSEDGANAGNCPNLPTDHCRAAEAGTYAHSEHERAATILAVSNKTSLCKDFLRGSCTLGDRCIYAHGEQELRRGEKRDAPSSSFNPVTPSITPRDLLLSPHQEDRCVSQVAPNTIVSSRFRTHGSASVGLRMVVTPRQPETD